MDDVIEPDGDIFVYGPYEAHGNWIVATDGVEPDAGLRIFKPLEEEPDLFLKFARLWRSRDFRVEAVAFSNRFGLPCGERQADSISPTRLKLDEFYRESRKAYAALTLYEAVLQKDEVAAAQIHEAHVDLDPRFEQHFFVTQPHVSTGAPPLTPLQGALAASVSVVRGTVEKLCKQAVYVTFDEPIPTPDAVKVTWQFRNLLGAMYLQMWWVITSNGELSRCKNCGRLISLHRPRPSGRKRRSDKVFCDDACRQAHHRARRRSSDQGDA